MLDTIWGRFEEFCRPQSNEVRARFDLLTSFWQGNKSADEWQHAVQTQVALAKYPPETAKILHMDIFWFFLEDEEFVSKTINDSKIDLDKFPTSKVRQHAKKMESSKATARHIKQVACDPQPAQINLMRHQCTYLPASKCKKRKPFVKPRSPSHKNDTSDRQSHYKKSFDAKNVYRNKERYQKCGDSNHIEGFQCPAKKFQCKSCHMYGPFTSLCYQKKQASFKSRYTKTHVLQAGAVPACDKSICGHSEYCSSSNESFYLQVKIQQAQAEGKKSPTASHLITNLAYKLKPHQTRNQYLRARLDICTDVDIMPASVYNLVFNDPELKKLAPSNLQIGTYTTDTVKIVRSCLFYLVHPDTKKLQEVTIYVARNDGSVLLFYTTTLALGIIHHKIRLFTSQS